MTSRVDIVNMGLFNAGTASVVSSINPSDGSNEADVASILYQPQIDNLSRSAHWNFTRRQENLVLLKSAQGTAENPDGILPVPLTPWLYSYAYPMDCLKARFLLPFINQQQQNPQLMTGISMQLSTWGFEAAIPFIVGTDKDDGGNLIKVILTNVPKAQLIYTGRIDDPNLWDPQFIIAAASLLGTWFVNPLARNAKMFSDNVTMLRGVVEQARISDGNEGMPRYDHTPDWIRIRELGGGSFIGPGNQFPVWYGWDSLAYPGGWV